MMDVREPWHWLDMVRQTCWKQVIGILDMSSQGRTYN